MNICPKCFVEIRTTGHLCAADVKDTVEKLTREELLVRIYKIKEIATRIGATQIVELCSRGTR